MRELPVRKNIRLKGWNYGNAGCYFITICVKNKHEMFGKVLDGKMMVNEHGAIAERNIINIPRHINHVSIDKYAVMPNHVHIIVRITENVGTPYMASAEPPSAEPPFAETRTPCMASLQIKSKQTLSKAMQQYKASVTRETAIAGLWQERFHDHIIRDEAEYQRVWQYIESNPERWTEDEFHP